jgi:hypothetical protein
MTFVLTPDNRDQPDDVLLEDLRRVAHQVSGKLTRGVYDQLGRFAPATVANRFGGWGVALERAGLVPPRRHVTSAEAVISDIKDVAQRLKLGSMSRELYERHGKYSERVVVKHFGSWLAAWRASGLDASEAYRPSASIEELFSNLEEVWRALGCPPKRNDMVPPISKLGPGGYVRAFGSWRRALEAFVESASKPTAAEPAAQPNDQSVAVEAVGATLGGTSGGRNRGVGWRLRYVVMARDRFTCRNCGRSPSSHLGVVLHIDHVVPWSRGGLTVESNLQTLCEQCNLGKGAA